MTSNHGSPIPLDTLVPSTVDATAALGLPPEVYDSAFYEFEVDAVFRTQWHCVGRAEMIPGPGDYFTTTSTGREPVIVARTRAGEIAVMSSVCQHRAMCITAPRERPRREWFDPPPEVSGNTRTFRCPYDWWTYNLDGELIGAPSMERTVGFSRADHGLPRLRVECWNGFVFANFSVDPRPLAAGLAAVDAALACYRLDEWVTQPPEVLTDVPFKLEGHGRELHGELHNYGLHNRLMSLEEYGQGNAGDEGEQFPYTPGDMAIFGVGHSGIDDPAVNATQRALFAPLASLNPVERCQVVFAYVAPTLLLGVFLDSAFWFTVEPTGPKAHTLSMGFFFPPGTSDDKFFPAILELYAKGHRAVQPAGPPRERRVATRDAIAVRATRPPVVSRQVPAPNSWLLDRYREAEAVPVG